MDKKPKDWKWLPDHMPGVAKMLAEQRAAMGAEHVAKCWQHGVLRQEPGWFFASEGPLAVGVPWADEPAIMQYLAGRITRTQVLLVLRPAG